jgi:hypothetical protein
MDELNFFFRLSNLALDIYLESKIGINKHLKKEKSKILFDDN